jgi:hypothetical protein
MLDAFQHVIVTAAALGAAYAIVRRLLGYARPVKARSACPSCATGEGSCARPSGSAGGRGHTAHTAVLYDRHTFESKGK